jgi:hypothetical protein
LTGLAEDRDMAAMLRTTEPPTVGATRATRLPGAGQIRREDPAASASGEAARELDAEVTRLLRVRGNELAEPLLWQRPTHRREVEAFVAQLAPIRSRISLLSSWERESRRGPALRLAYAIVFLRLARRRAAAYGPRVRRANLPHGLRLITGRG